jgi:hypothetical protein
MRLRVHTVLLLVVAITLALSASASASHPSTWATPPECTAQLAMANYQVVSADGERWLCKYDPDLDILYWEPVGPTENPADGVVWLRTTWTATDGISHVVMPRLEWINYKLYSGADSFVRMPLTAPLFAAAGSVGVFSRLLVWNAATATWSTCRESGWVHNTAASDTLAPTFSWGNTPCGTAWYAAVGWVEHGSSSGTWLQSPMFASDGPGTRSAGANASNGHIWDPKPGDRTRPPKRPRKAPMPSNAPKDTAPTPLAGLNWAGL